MVWHVNKIVWLFFVSLSFTFFSSQTHCAEIGKAGVYSIVELTFHGPLQNEKDVPARDIDFWIRFRHESGSPEYKIHGFWDGDGNGGTSGNVFKVRFCPTNLLLTPADIMPSLLGLMGLADCIPRDVEGSDYSSIMRGKPGSRPTSALYLVCTGPRGGARGVRTGRYTFTIRPDEDGKKEILLFDNQKDPYQLNNIAESNPKAVRKLTEELDRWLKKTNDPWKA